MIKFLTKLLSFGLRSQKVDELALKRRYPTSLALRSEAKKRLPNFAFEYGDGGAGEDTGIIRNWTSLDRIQMVPRYGRVVSPPPCDITLFGRDYAAPVGIAPIGSPGTAFPGAEAYLAKAANAANIPFTLGLLSGLSIEHAAKLAPNVLWLQLYRFSRDNHRIGMDLVRRATEAGVKALVLTIDTPTRTTRPREVRSGITNPFRMTYKLRLDALRSRSWMGSLMQNGIPKFVSLTPYMGSGTSLAEAAAFIRRESGGAFTWDEISRYRDKWKNPLLLKGVMHPDDAERAAALGIDGLFVTNHGGRQIDALPASIDVLPIIAERVNGRMSIIFDSGVRSGVDVARAIALGADAAFLGKAFLWSLGALGDVGPRHLINLLMEDLSATLGQLGCNGVPELRSVNVHHPSAYTLEDLN